MSEWNLRAVTLYLRAIQIKEISDRQAFLSAQIGDDVDLRQRVDALMSADERPETRHDTPSSPELPTTQDHQPASDVAGQVIGKYKLLQKLGAGGFGVVYMAEQDKPIRRTVALKIIKPGMDTEQVIARFESERQALALMDHPNIAKVLDAGSTESGRPYFVMELVKGISITHYCDKGRLPVESRLRLFCTVCCAIQHAHNKGIIHRDVKPSNVLVAEPDGAAAIKVIDFGVAKALTQKLTDKSLFTIYGQMIGTPTYMSPEQADSGPLEIDGRSDVYSLGVLLYELLTGTTPLEAKKLKDANYGQVQRLICEEQTPTPSVRLRALGDSALAAAEKRGADVGRLTKLLAGDLSCIVMKALEKDRNRRYESPATIAEDVERYLRKEPVRARRVSATMSLVWRKTATALVSALIFLSLLGLALGFVARHNRQDQSRIDPVPPPETPSARLRDSFDPKIPPEGRAIPMGGRVGSVAFSPDGRMFAAGIAEKRQPEDAAGLVVWELASGKKLRHIWPDRAVSSLLFTPENDFLVFGSGDAVSDWNFITDKDNVQFRYRRDGATITGLAVSRVAKAFAVSIYVAADSESNGVNQWVHPGGSSLPGIRDPAPIEQILYSPHDGVLAAAHRDGTVELWDHLKATPVTGPPIKATAKPAALAFAPDRSILAVAASGKVRFWDRRELPQKWLDLELNVSGHVNALAYTSDGKHLAIADEKEDVTIWDVFSGKPVLTLSGHRNGVLDLMFSPDNKLLATGSDDGDVRLWDVAAALAK
jgi:serine/threonine protein kinase